MVTYWLVGILYIKRGCGLVDRGRGLVNMPIVSYVLLKYLIKQFNWLKLMDLLIN